MAPLFFTPEIQQRSEAVHNLIESSLLHPDAGLSALETNAAANLDSIDVAPNEGKFLYLLAKLTNAKRILEIGTLSGYSALWFAKAVGPSGSVISLEADEKHASIARSNIENAGFGDVVEVRVGKGMETLETMKQEGKWNRGSGGEFDMVFIDANKENNVGYLKYALQMARVGVWLWLIMLL